MILAESLYCLYQDALNSFSDYKIVSNWDLTLKKSVIIMQAVSYRTCLSDKQYELILVFKVTEG